MIREEKKELPQGLKMALDFAPLAAFFVTYKLGGMYWATGLLMALTLVTLVVGYLMTGKLAKFPLYSAILVGVLGGLTLYFQDGTFVKMKPTVVNLLFAAVLAGGLYFNRIFLRDLLGSTMDLPDAAWRQLTLRWAGFFMALALLNEFVWRSMSEEAWVNFKVFGLLGLTIVFAAANTPFMMKHMTEKHDDPSANG
jgi:intracellular septation protein